jgi:hypothetical protein
VFLKTIALTLFLLIISVTCNANEASFSYGLGIGNSAKHSYSETKVFSVAYRTDLIDGFYLNHQVGVWGDTSGTDGRKSSAFVSSGGGFKVDLRPVEIRNGLSLAIIGVPDSYLGSPFPQFHEEIYVGVRDLRGNAIGIKYNHVSSGGIVTPNMGRDFIMIELGQKF